MTAEANRSPAPVKTARKSSDTFIASRMILLLVILLLISSFFVVIEAGQRGILLKFGQVQEQILGEGIHAIVPLVNTVHKLSVRIQNQEISAEASSKDLQEVYTDVALNWHIIPTEANLLYRRIGDQLAVVERIINPAVEEVLKAVMAKYTAEEIITRRGEVKASVDQSLTERLLNYHIAVDDISLVHVHFSERFSEAVEAKQIAEQEAKRAEFIAVKAIQEAQAKLNLARGEAAANQVLRDTVTPELLQREAIAKWNGNLPLIVGNEGAKFLDLNQMIRTNEQIRDKSRSAK
jgi:regulator of protease activity HflC (stomatin/prohibitin superfamily)